jgi:adenosylhomocysteine nucleosidase
VSILVVSATPEEAAHVPAPYRLLITGVGKVASATAVADALARDPAITEVVNIGSAGSLHDHLGGLHLVGSVHNHDLSAEALRGFGYDPQEWIGLGDGVRLATGDLFVADPAVRSRLAEVADLVDMEGYAVVWAARRAGVAVTLVKHVSDQADDGAWEWADLVDHSARELAAWLVAHRPVSARSA